MLNEEEREARPRIIKWQIISGGRRARAWKMNEPERGRLKGATKAEEREKKKRRERDEKEPG